MENDGLEVWTTWKILKARKLNGAFRRYFEMLFGKFELLKQNESKEAKWCILALFETEFGSWNCLENAESKEAKWCILHGCFGSWNCLKKLKPKKLDGAFGRFSQNVVDDFHGSYWMWKYVHHWNNS